MFKDQKNNLPVKITTQEKKKICFFHQRAKHPRPLIRDSQDRQGGGVFSVKKTVTIILYKNSKFLLLSGDKSV